MSVFVLGSGGMFGTFASTSASATPFADAVFALANAFQAVAKAVTVMIEACRSWLPIYLNQSKRKPSLQSREYIDGVEINGGSGN
jgi:hypothetical protein